MQDVSCQLQSVVGIGGTQGNKNKTRHICLSGVARWFNCKHNIVSHKTTIKARVNHNCWIWYRTTQPRVGSKQNKTLNSPFTLQIATVQQNAPHTCRVNNHVRLARPQSSDRPYSRASMRRGRTSYRQTASVHAPTTTPCKPALQALDFHAPLVGRGTPALSGLAAGNPSTWSFTWAWPGAVSEGHHDAFLWSLGDARTCHLARTSLFPKNH